MMMICVRPRSTRWIWWHANSSSSRACGVWSWVRDSAPWPNTWRPSTGSVWWDTTVRGIQLVVLLLPFVDVWFTILCNIYTYVLTCVCYTPHHIVSKEQIEYARESCRGLSNVEFVQDDYRHAAHRPEHIKAFDRVYSVGLLEHVGRHNYRGYYELVETCLKDDGLHLVHAITMRDSSVPRTEDWTNKYIFPGGELPHPQDYFTYSAGLLVVEDVHSLSLSYVKTLRVWKKNFIANWPQLEATYGKMMDGKFYRMWIYYLDQSIGTFEGRLIHLYQVVHSKQGCKLGALRPGYDSVR
jgi:Mycolic acid cyclopropane synthetase